MAYRICLISSKFCCDLHLVSKIRNEFAHDIYDCTFNKLKVQNRIVELMRSTEIHKKAPKERSDFPDGPKGDFAISFSWMLWRLWELIDKVDAIKPPPDEFVYGVGPEWDSNKKD